MTWWIVGVMVFTGLLLAGLIYFNSRSSVSNKTTRQLALACTTEMATQFHIHPNLEIDINGQKQEIPANIGISGVCMNAIHTHDNSGLIHVESPEKRDFTLEDFFFIWGKTFTKDQILDSKVDSTHVVRETVNGKDSQDYEKTVLHDGDKIIISYEEIKK